MPHKAEAAGGRGGREEGRPPKIFGILFSQDFLEGLGPGAEAAGGWE